MFGLLHVLDYWIFNNPVKCSYGNKKEQNTAADNPAFNKRCANFGHVNFGDDGKVGVFYRRVCCQHFHIAKIKPDSHPDLAFEIHPHGPGGTSVNGYSVNRRIVTEVHYKGSKATFIPAQ